MLNCHDLMMEKKPIMASVAIELGFTRNEFESFWQIYYPERINQDISVENAEICITWIRNHAMVLSRQACPYCQASRSCSVCEYGKIQRLCETVDSGYQRAFNIWKGHVFV